MNHFDTMEDAFAVCRERNQPTIANVAGQRWKLFPSGRADRLDADEKFGKACGVACCEETFLTAAEAQAHEDRHGAELLRVRGYV